MSEAAAARGSELGIRGADGGSIRSKDLNNSALSGLRVLDLSGIGPGQFCTMLLGDLGADVILVDRPLPAAAGNGSIPDATSDGFPRPSYDAFARNKHRIGLDLRRPGALEVVRTLAASVDVVVVQMRPGKPAALGIGYDDLRKINGRIVYCMISGFGENGPLRDRAGHDLNYLGVSGALALFARRTTPPSSPPNIIADYGAAGMMAATSILAALHARATKGEGQSIDISMTDATTYLLAEWMSTTFDPVGDPNLLVDYPPYDVYECADGRLLAVGCVEPRFWASLCDVLNREDLFELASRPGESERLRHELERIFASEPRDAWLARFDSVDVPITTVNRIEELPDDPQARAREMVVELDSPGGTTRQVGIAPKFSATPGSIRRVGVVPGADTVPLLLEAGFTEQQIAILKSENAVFGPDQ